MSSIHSEHDASTIARSILVGCFLDRVTAYSLQVVMGFLTQDPVDGSLKEASVTFTCGAAIEHIDGHAKQAEIRDFFAGRSTFLSNVHGLIGKVVSSVEVHKDGGLILNIEDSLLELWITAEDLLVDDWIWAVGIEGTDAHSLYCCPEDNAIAFVQGQLTCSD